MKGVDDVNSKVVAQFKQNNQKFYKKYLERY